MKRRGVWKRFAGGPAALLPPLLALLIYFPSLFSRSFLRDDWHIIVENPVLQGPLGAALKGIWSTGYWQAVWGGGATISEYRPITMLTFLADFRLFGLAPGPMHVQNILLHAANCFLLLMLLRRFLSSRAAWIAALFFAVMPVHSEAVCGIVNRTELLAMFWVLCAWLALDGEPGPPRIAAGTAFYLLGLLSKEHVILFPVVLAMSDWALRKRNPWGRGRLAAQISLWTASALYLLVRAMVFGRPLRGGPSYFAGISPLVQALTTARFWTERYLWPAVTGLGLGIDLSRPLIPDSGPSDIIAWLCLALLLGGAAMSAWYFVRRRPAWTFWILGPSLFLLPTSHLLIPLDALGAQRFLYLPSISVAAGAGWLVDRLMQVSRLRRPAVAAFAVLALSQAGHTVSRARIWRSDLSYYADATRFNPVSPGARIGLGVALLEAGDRAGAAREFQESVRLDPGFSPGWYNLGKLAWESGRAENAEDMFRRAAALNPEDASTLDFLALAAQRRGSGREAESFYLSALAVQPRDAAALFNLGRLYWTENSRDKARGIWTRFLELFPDDPDAPAVRRALTEKENRKGSGKKG